VAELPDDIYAEVRRLSEEGNEFADRDDVIPALERFQAAWGLLPEPRTQWSAGLWLLASMGDMQFFCEEYASARDSLMTAMREYDEGRGNPFICLRLGQCMYELGDTKGSANWLAGAFMLEGHEIFEQEDPKYWAFLKTQLKPPPGGWPDEQGGG
jgi:hypothetical protein